MERDIYKKIKTLRKKKGLSQENMAFELNISVSAYSNIERGVTDINFSKLERIAEIFEIKLTELFSFSEVENQSQGNDLNEFIKMKIITIEKELTYYKMLQKMI